MHQPIEDDPLSPRPYYGNSKASTVLTWEAVRYSFTNTN